MSSLRNAVQRRNHRERAQPTERSKWGLLEKRKDYKLRATDHKTKQRKISALKQKASERNEDEFYFGMVNATTKNGIRNAKRGEENSGGGGKALSLDVVKLMKTQDRGYLQTMLQRAKKERERIEQDVIVGETGVRLEPGNKRTVLDEDAEVESGIARPMAQDEEEFEMDMDMDMDMDLDLLDSEVEDMASSGDGDESEDEDLSPEQRTAKRRKRHELDTKRKKLDALREQEEKLAAALDQVDQQRAKMNGSIGGINKNGVKFKYRQRKR